jgi:hypothetical protein
MVYNFRAMLLLVSCYPTQLSNTVVKAKIEIEEIEGSISNWTADNLSEIVQSLSYKLSVIKKTISIIINLIMPKKDYFLYSQVKIKICLQHK